MDNLKWKPYIVRNGKEVEYMRMLFIVLGLLVMLTGCSGNPAKKQETPPPAAPNNTSTAQQRVFNLDELKNYNGQNGNPAYVAVNGVVYDVTNSSKWKNGVHKACSSSTQAGVDFSDSIKSSPHGVNVMSKFPQIGTLQK